VLFTNNISDSEEKKRIVRDEYGFKLTDAFNEEVDTMCNLSEGIARKNKAEGINEGRALGREEGIEIGRIESFVGLVKKGLLTIEQAANELGKSVEEFKTLMNK
jgi:flagellar biosynthesis/type III secretory pathway protein FliH